MWLLFFPALAQAITCPVVTRPRVYDTELLSLNPASCSTSNFERYTGFYTTASSSNPSVEQISCNLGPASLLFDNRPTAWNTGFSPAALETASRKGDNAQGSLDAAFVESTEIAPAYVVFQTENISPIGISFKNYGDTTHDAKSASLFSADTASGTWTLVRSFSLVAGTSDEQYIPIFVPQPHKFWRVTIPQLPSSVVYLREIQFYTNALPLRLLPSLGDFPNAYYPLMGNSLSFDNSTSTYQEYSGPYFAFLFFAQTYLNIDQVTGVYWKSSGAVSSYGISKYSLRPLETQLLDKPDDELHGFRYGNWTTPLGASSALGTITNWNDNPTFTFIFSALPVGSSTTMRLAELALVGCPKYSCPCSAVSRTNYTSVTCSGGGSTCTMVDKPFAPISL